MRQVAANAVALLSTVGKVVLENNAQGIWRTGLNWSAGRSLATPVLRHCCCGDVHRTVVRDYFYVKYMCYWRNNVIL